MHSSHLCIVLIFILSLFNSSRTLGQEVKSISRDQEKREYADLIYQAAKATNDTSQLVEAYYLYGKLARPIDQALVVEWFKKALGLLENKPASFEKGRPFMQLSFAAKFMNEYSQEQYYGKERRR